jgi:hypothetical protein
VCLVALLTTGMAELACTHRSGLSLVGGKADAGRGGVDDAASSGGDLRADQSDTGGDSAAGGSDLAGNSSIVGTCVTADDCVSVLDYRAGFSCWVPSAASLGDVSRDPCLVPWKPNARCTTPPPPAGCTGGLQAVNHSCFLIPCAIPACKDGKCSFTLGFGGQCGAVDAGTPDCEILRTTLVNALAAAQQCDPTQTSPTCLGDYADTCGCEAPYDLSSPYANAVQCAFGDWSNANCRVVDCGKTCVAPTAAGATCVPNATGKMGTCAWK